MKILVISDIHDNIWKLEKALKKCDPVELAIFCGDFCAPFTLKQLAEFPAKALHVVFGNNDGDRFLLTKIARDYPHVVLHGEFAKIEAGDLKIAVNHYPEIAAEIAKSDAFDVVFYGHNHEHRIEKIGSTDLINPGEIMGRFGRSTFVIYDTETRSCETIEV
ncbi:MAG: metallophosphoesterase [Deferribacteres bacterium]|nr:metallophosphoesterase [candidate division KSB1 bacterium]MCB9511355.1 metallophosphoesterase [Deferribacteres bacterium]